MPMPIHMTIEGEVQGEFGGGCRIGGRENTMLINAFEHKVAMPTNPQDGQPTGKRVHGPIVVTKEVDEASPLLYAALKGAENCAVEIKWYRQADNIEQHYFTTVLVNAVVVGVQAFFPNTKDKPTEKYGHMEKVSLRYQKIIWTHVVESKEAEDDWLVADAG